MTIFTNGTFDLLTTGHFNLLLFCHHIAGPNGEVYVSLDSNDKIRKDKGEGKPIFDYNERMDAIDALRIHDVPVVNGGFFVHDSNGELDDIIRKLKPDYIVVGSDYKGKIVVGSEHANVIFFERDKIFSSTKIIEACRR